MSINQLADFHLSPANIRVHESKLFEVQQRINSGLLSSDHSFFFYFQRDKYDLLEMFLNSEYDPEKVDSDQLSDFEKCTSFPSLNKSLSSQVLTHTPPPPSSSSSSSSSSSPSPISSSSSSTSFSFSLSLPPPLLLLLLLFLLLLHLVFFPFFSFFCYHLFIIIFFFYFFFFLFFFFFFFSFIALKCQELKFYVSYSVKADLYICKKCQADLSQNFFSFF